MIKKHKRTSSSNQLHCVLNLQQYQSSKHQPIQHKLLILQSVYYPNYQNQNKPDIHNLIKESGKALSQKVVMVERIDYVQDAKERQMFQFGRGLIKSHQIRNNQYGNQIIKKQTRYVDENLFRIPQINKHQKNSKIKESKQKIRVNSKTKNQNQIVGSITCRKISQNLTKQYFAGAQKQLGAYIRHKNLVIKKQINLNTKAKRKKSEQHIVLSARSTPQKIENKSKKKKILLKK